MDVTVVTLVDRYKWIHQVLRDEIQGLTPEQIDHVPAPETSSIGVLVTHILGSEAEVWSIVAGEGSTRDRPAEFQAKGATAEALVAAIDEADRLLDERASRIDAAALARIWPRPNRNPHTGLHWLLHNYGHAREHLGHLQLTKHLFPHSYPPVARRF